MKIQLHNIPIYAFHGAFPHEQEFGARFEIDVDFELPDRAAESDALVDTIDYVAVHRYLREHAHGKHFNLIETWALMLSADLLKEFTLADEVTIRIRKPGASIGGLIEYVQVEHRSVRR